MRLRAPMIIGLTALLLAGCGGGKKVGERGTGDTPPDPPEAAADFHQDVDGRGLDPAFGLKIRRGVEISLTRPGQPDVVVTAPGAVIQPDQASWSAPMADGQMMKVVLYSSGCSDNSDSNLVYPYAVEIDLPNESPLAGCAGKPSVHKASR